MPSAGIQAIKDAPIVATPLPPLKLRHIGNTCPQTAHIMASCPVPRARYRDIIYTGMKAFKASNKKVIIPIFRPATRQALVAPILPDPCVRKSLTPKTLEIKSPPKTLHNKYVHIKAKNFSTIIV